MLRRPVLSVVGETTPAAGAARAMRAAPKPKRRKAPKLLQITRSIEVFDADGHHLRSYCVVLGANCVEAEYEEYALIMAERDGLVAAEEAALCWARCEA